MSSFDIRRRCWVSFQVSFLLLSICALFLLSNNNGVLGQVAEQPNPKCNLTLYTDWRNSIYLGPLASDPTFWRYQTQTEFILSNGLAMDLAVSKCDNHFQLLYKFLNGRNGPIDIQHVYKAMCKSECIQSDELHNEAISYAQCTCLQLSTQQTDISYHTYGDWCNDNSARSLCNILGYCGIWGCRIDDFMCPRFEWNKKLIYLKGPGTCDKLVKGAATSAAIRSSSGGSMARQLLLSGMLSLLVCFSLLFPSFSFAASPSSSDTLSPNLSPSSSFTYSSSYSGLPLSRSSSPFSFNYFSSSSYLPSSCNQGKIL